MGLKQYIPKPVKLQLKLFSRYASDVISGKYKIISQSKAEVNENSKLTLSQPIFYNPLSQNKIDNINIASKCIEPIIIKPNEMFSFWKLVGKPTPFRGFKTGRNILGDSLQEDIGGGLCQISGIIYHLALIAGLEIEERFCHTIDLYTEDNRYTPIGTDGTVVYGYKDIRFINNSKHNLQFKFKTEEDKFTAHLISDGQLFENKLEFNRQEHKGYRTVDTYRINSENKKQFINQSKYLLPK
jgi:vancomycin resistance protein VanW